MCSDSAGSIQVALKKLLADGFVTVKEGVENGVNKKRYSITEQGKDEFFRWLKKPMTNKKQKNIELAKLFFMGSLEPQEQINSLKAYVEEIGEDLELLIQIREQMFQVYKVSSFDQLPDNNYFGLMSLEYGIDTIRYEIDWYTDLIKKIEKRKQQ